MSVDHLEFLEELSSNGHVVTRMLMTFLMQEG